MTVLHDSGSVLRVGVPAGEAAGALVLLHGRGASAEDILGLAGYLPVAGLALVAPQARGAAWYPQRFFVPIEENEPWLSSALELVDSEVRALLDAGIPEERIGLAGFSQGGCLALEYAVRYPRSYGFVAGLSAALVGPLGTSRPRPGLAGVPVLVACAAQDPHIPLPYVEESLVLMREQSADVTEQIYRGGDHQIFPQEMEWIAGHISNWK